MNRWIVRGLFIAFAFFSVERFCHKQTKGFRTQKIYANLPYNSDWEIAPLSEEDTNNLQTILSQPFHYLDSGGECYAFISADKEYVLKCFKLHHMRPGGIEEKILPKAMKVMRAHKLRRLFQSCMLAYEKFRTQTGLVYLHLNKTEHLHTRLKLFDAIGAVHSLDLDTLPFALQKRAQLAYPTLTALADAKETALAKKRIQSFVKLIVSRSAAGLVDHDARARNFGFIGDRAIEIDIGSFSLDPKIESPKEVKRVLLYETAKLRRYLKKRHPELVETLDAEIQTYLTDPSCEL